MVLGAKGSKKRVVNILLRGCWLHYKMVEKEKGDWAYAADAKFMVRPGFIINHFVGNKVTPREQH